MHQPKGYLVAIGGAEDKGEEEKLRSKHKNFFETGILKHLLDLCSRRAEPRLEVITTASSIPDEVAQSYKRAFKKLGCSEVGHLKLANREEADQPKILERIRQCTGVLFSGGDQLKLCSALGGSQFIRIIQERFNDEPFVIAGTSAGAAAMSNTMISGGDETKAFMKGEVNFSIGFGFMPSVIIDTHFDARGRFGRLVQAIAAQPGSIGVGLDEDTGVVIEKGQRMRAIGSSSVVVVDGSHVSCNNIAAISNGMPLSVSNIYVHAMTQGDSYDLISRHFTAAG